MTSSVVRSDIELAARLRPVLVRMARRLRQESGTDLSPSLATALATIDRRGPLTPSGLAEIERAHPQGLTSRQIVDLFETRGIRFSEATLRKVDNHVMSLRRVLGDDPRRPRWIHTVRGHGYRLARADGD